MVAGDECDLGTGAERDVAEGRVLAASFASAELLPGRPALRAGHVTGVQRGPAPAPTARSPCGTGEPSALGHRPRGAAHGPALAGASPRRQRSTSCGRSGAPSLSSRLCAALGLRQSGRGKPRRAASPRCDRAQKMPWVSRKKSRTMHAAAPRASASPRSTLSNSSAPPRRIASRRSPNCSTRSAGPAATGPCRVSTSASKAVVQRAPAGVVAGPPQAVDQQLRRGRDAAGRRRVPAARPARWLRRSGAMRGSSGAAVHQRGQRIGRGAEAPFVGRAGRAVASSRSSSSTSSASPCTAPHCTT